MLSLICLSAKKAVGPQFWSSKHQFLKPIRNRRTLLTSTFSCDATWRARLSAPELSAAGGVSAVDLGNGLMRTLNRREPMASVDLDVYVNKMDSFDTEYLEFFASLLRKFRSTQDFLAKLESTDHALVRCMVSMGHSRLLVDWLRDKFTYGIFLDQYSASILIDHLLEAGDTKLAALVSFDHAVQETTDSDSLVLIGLMLLASTARAADQLPVWTSESGDKQGQEADEDGEAEDDPDTRHVIVDYIRLPNYDGHFDLNEERLQVGHTLVCLSRRLMSSNQQQPQFSETTKPASIGLSCALIGLAALEKPDQILKLVERHRNPRGTAVVTSSALGAADALLATARTLGEGQSEAQRRGMRPLCRKDSVDAARAALKTLTIQSDAANNSTSWHSDAAALARSLVAEHEAASGQQLASVYAKFEATRLTELRRHGDWLRRRRLFQSTKAQLNSLVEEQEALTAFDNRAEIRYAAWLAPRTRAELRLSTKEIWAADTANANRMIDAIKEAATRSGIATDSSIDAVDARMLKKAASSAIKDRFKPLKE